MEYSKTPIAIIGGGINGLLNAWFLSLNGYKKISIYTDTPSLKTTTTVAGAVWMPYKAQPANKALNWAKKSLEYFEKFAEIPNSCIVYRNYTVFFSEPIEKPEWMKLANNGIAYDCNTPNNASCSYSIHAPIIDTYGFICYLLSELKKYKVPIIQKKINDFRELKDFKIIINSTGFGARQLAHDDKVFSIKGQIFKLNQPPKKITQCVFFDEGKLITLVVPHKNHIILGVTVHENDESTNYDENEERKIFASACHLYPQLADLKVLERKVGLRPCRVDGIRLETEYLNDSDQYIIHNYGHAGGGVALAPGCAEEVQNQIKSIENIN